MSHNKKCHILYLDTGFKYHMDVTYGPKLRQLSDAFRGTVITFGEPGFHRFGLFSVHSFSILRSKLLIFLRAYRHALRLIRRGRRMGMPVDVMISYDAINTGLLGTLISATTGVPLIVEVNGDVSNWSNYADIPGATKRRIKRRLYIAIAAFVMRHARGLKLLYSTQLDHFPARLSRRPVVHTFPNFLDLTEFTDLGEQKRVVIVGFPFTVKGIDIAIAAFRKIADEFPDWSLEVLGWYRDADKEVLEGAIGGHPQIRHVEAIFKRDMPRYLGSCGVALCASRTEGFPRVIKEAMYAGKPCIVSRVGGLPEVFEQGVNGLLFRSEDVDDLAAQLRHMLSDPELRRRLGAAGQRYAYAHFTNAAYIDYLRRFTGEVLQRTSGRTA
jgi:glycosyltransferase involved in cell wall biosynthesis